MNLTSFGQTIPHQWNFPNNTKVYNPESYNLMFDLQTFKYFFLKDPFGSSSVVCYISLIYYNVQILSPQQGVVQMALFQPILKIE